MSFKQSNPKSSNRIIPHDHIIRLEATQGMC